MSLAIKSRLRSVLEVNRGVETVLSGHGCCPRSVNPSLMLVRHAQHKQQGSVNGTKDGAGRRLGAKKGSEEYVIPGQIIYRQRGTLWHAGENVGLGRDHTIFALQPGYVKYYRNPTLNPKKRYIGVALSRNQSLPTPPDVPRVRRLGMVAIPRTAHKEFADAPESAGAQAEIPVTHIPPIIPSDGPSRAESTTGLRLTDDEVRNLKRGKDGAYRQQNWEIGRVAERAGLEKKLPRNADFRERSRFKSRQRNASVKRKSMIKAVVRAEREKKRKLKRTTRTR